GSRFGLVHIGDSRIYRLRAGELAQLTRDHTLVQSLVDEGRLTEAEAAEHPRRSMLMRALQGTSTVEPDVSLCEVASGDRYLLCSDGLTDVVGPRAIQEVLAAVPEPQTAVNRLIRLANRGGGPDNITC